jgi:hypothetical protein
MDAIGRTTWVIPEGWIVVQHTRLDSRQSENALLSTIAFPG